MVRENIPAIWMGTIGHGFLNLTKWVFYIKIVNAIYIVREGIRGERPRLHRGMDSLAEKTQEGEN